MKENTYHHPKKKPRAKKERKSPSKSSWVWDPSIFSRFFWKWFIFPPNSISWWKDDVIRNLIGYPKEILNEKRFNLLRKHFFPPVSGNYISSLSLSERKKGWGDCGVQDLLIFGNTVPMWAWSWQSAGVSTEREAVVLWLPEAGIDRSGIRPNPLWLPQYGGTESTISDL